MMKKSLCILIILIGSISLASAQKYFTKEGKISFYSDAPMEKIEAHNNSASSVVDMASGKLEFAVLIKGFQFEKALMQEHFNENYMESGKFPKATFKGQLADLSAINLKKSGTYTTKVKGDLTIHGVTQPVETTATFKVNGTDISAQSQFMVKVADYDIEIPSVVADNIAKEVKITVDVNYKELKR